MTDARERAERLLAGRLDVITQAEAAHAEVARIERDLAEAQKVSADLWAQCIKTGWSANELRSLGLSEPNVTRRRRTPKRRGADSPGTRTETNSPERETTTPDTYGD